MTCLRLRHGRRGLWTVGLMLAGWLSLGGLTLAGHALGKTLMSSSSTNDASSTPAARSSAPATVRLAASGAPAAPRVGSTDQPVPPIVNPSTVAFTASADHATTDKYTLELNRAGAVTKTVDLGKPTPDATNTITAPLTALLAGVPACAGPADGCYTVTVTASNGFGVGRSLPSSGFSSGRAPAAPGTPVTK